MRSVSEAEPSKFDECAPSKTDLRLHEGVTDILPVIKVSEGKLSQENSHTLREHHHPLTVSVCKLSLKTANQCEYCIANTLVSSRYVLLRNKSITFLSS